MLSVATHSSAPPYWAATAGPSSHSPPPIEEPARIRPGPSIAARAASPKRGADGSAPRCHRGMRCDPGQGAVAASAAPSATRSDTGMPFEADRPMLRGRCLDGRHHFLHTKAVNERGPAGALPVNGLDELEVLVVPEALPRVGLAVAGRTGDLPELGRHGFLGIVAPFACPEHAKRMRQLVDHRAVAAVDFAEVAAGDAAGV